MVPDPRQSHGDWDDDRTPTLATVGFVSSNYAVEKRTKREYVLARIPALPYQSGAMDEVPT
ncbi:hypothetical protein PMI09_04617 [Rhizobium sp. CF122]|nr:hypothetical protein PMI09_04617 [Rhizobium sp. CF122]